VLLPAAAALAVERLMSLHCLALVNVAAPASAPAKAILEV
jgi:hypothetical protein